MESRLKKRVVNLERRAAGAMPTHTPVDAATVAAGFEALRRQFAARLADIGRRDALPVAEQLQCARDDLNTMLAAQAEQEVRAAHDGTSDDDGWAELKEKFKRSWIRHLEIAVLQAS